MDDLVIFIGFFFDFLLLDILKFLYFLVLILFKLVHLLFKEIHFPVVFKGCVFEVLSKFVQALLGFLEFSFELLVNSDDFLEFSILVHGGLFGGLELVVEVIQLLFSVLLFAFDLVALGGEDLELVAELVDFLLVVLLGRIGKEWEYS